MAPAQLVCLRGKMAELNLPIYDFRRGVLTPKLKDRPNLDLYKSGVLVGENFLSSLHGPTTYRPGFIYSRTTRRNNIAHFIPFTFADDEAYTLSFTEGYMRIFTDSGTGTIPGVLNEDSLAISGITQANPGVLTVVGNDFANGDEVYIEDAVGMTELNGQFFLVVSGVFPGTSERNWPLSDALNYTFNAANIAVTAGVARLKSAGANTDYDFETATEYTYPVTIDVTGGVAKLSGGPGTYAITDPVIETNNGFIFITALTSFVATETIAGADGIKYAVSMDDGANYVYWNGAAWVASAGTYAQSNTATVVDAHISTLGAAGTFKFKAVLHSATGATTPQLDNVLVGNLTYPLTDPPIETKSGFPFTVALEDFTETATKPANTELKYIVSIDNGVTYQYWTGAAWAGSAGTYAQSNTAATINTHISTLGASGTFKFKAFLHTTDAAVTPSLSNIHTQFTVVASNTFSLTDQDGNATDTSGFEAYTGSGIVSRVYEIESPYLEADLPQLKFAQKADIMYIDHPAYAPRKLTRFGDGTWTLTTYTRTNDPFEQKEIINITQANPASVTTATAHGYVDGDEILIEDVSGMTEVNHEIYTVTLVNSTNFTIGVNSTAYGAYTSGGVVLLDGNAPATVGFYGGRVFHGGSTNDPDLLFGSRSPDPADGSTRYEDFTVGADPDDGVSYALTSASTSSVDRIRFFMGTRQFLASGTYAGMLKINGGSDSVPISGTAIESFPVDNFGVADIMPANFGTDIIYVQRGGEVVYSFKYTLLSDGFKSEDETIQSDEITRNGVKQLAYQQGNPNQIWAAMNDGRLLSFVYSDRESVSAWNEHLMGGEGSVLTVSAQPQEDNQDRVWSVVERVINGVTRRYVEYLSKNPRIPERKEFYTGTTSTYKETDESKYRNLMFFAQKRQVHLDSSLSLDTTQTTTITPAAVSGDDVSFVSGVSLFKSTDLLRKIQVKYVTGTEQGIAKIIEYVSETEVKCQILQEFESTDTIASGNWYLTQDTVSGLDHLEGETVSIVADGGIHPDRVVTNGSITLANQATYVIVGMFYFGRVQTMPLELLLSTGITPGKYTSVDKIKLMFRNSLGVSYGTNPYDMQRIGFRQGPQYTDRPTFLFNGVKEQPGFDSYDAQRTMWVIQTVPYPCTLNAMVLDIEVSQEN